MRWYLSAKARLGVALIIASLSSVALFFVGAIRTHETIYAYLVWNLFLAWIPFALTLWLVKILRKQLWSSWQAIVMTIAWLFFLPNSFYLISDLTHLEDMPHVYQLYDAMMFASFVMNGVILGFISVYLVHNELLKRLSKRFSTILVTVTLLLCSYAVYLGHSLRWNTWDVLLNPAGVLVGVSDPILHPRADSSALITAITFFVLLSTTYAIIWQLVRVVRMQKA
ncbi:MAG TPA: DUF1361 domain-containing protein [Candidatus Saccharimonadales bacterium]